MIRNANSAIERVRNQFSYKLGQAMIASSKAAEGGGGYYPSKYLYIKLRKIIQKIIKSTNKPFKFFHNLNIQN